MFKVDQVLLGIIPAGDDQCRFNYLALETAIKKVIKERLGYADFKMSATTNKPGCRTFVVAKMALFMNASPTLFRSYECDGFESSNFPMWQAARATSAAPTFFKPIHIEPPRPGIIYVDGGLGFNNPSRLAREEAGHIWPKSKSYCLVSIGTGHQSAARFDFPHLDNNVEAQRTVFGYIKDLVPGLLSHVPDWETVGNFSHGVVAVIKMASALASLITYSEDVHQSMFREAQTAQFPYYRFNVERQVGDIGLGDRTKSRDIAALTIGYMRDLDIRNKTAACVQRLISYHNFTCK